MADQSHIQLLAAEVARLDALNKKLRADKDAAEARLEDVTNAKDEEIDALQTQLRTQKGLTAEAEANFDHLQTQTETGNRENEAAKKKIEAKDKEIAKLTASAQGKEEWIASLEIQLQKAQNDVDENAKTRMEAQIATLKTGLATKETAYLNLRDAYHEYQRSVAPLQAQLQASNDRITQLEAQHAIEVERLTTENQRIQAISQENAALEEQLARFTQEVNDDINREPEAHVAHDGTGQTNTLDQEIHSNLGSSHHASTAASSEHEDDSEDGDTERGSSDSSSDDSDDEGPIQEVIRYVDVERIVQVNRPATTMSHNSIYCWFTTESVTLFIIKWAFFEYLPYLMRSNRRTPVIRIAPSPASPNPEPNHGPNRKPTELVPEPNPSPEPTCEPTEPAPEPIPESNPEPTEPVSKPNPNPEPTPEPDQSIPTAMATIAPGTGMNTVFPPSDSNPGPIPPAPLSKDPLPPLPNPAPPGQQNPNPAPNPDQPDPQNPVADTAAPRMPLPASLSIWNLIFNLLVHMLLYYLIYSTWKERSLWLAANGLTRSFVWGLTRFAERKGADYSVWSGFFGEAVTESLDKVALRIIEGLGGERRAWVVAG